MKNRVSAGDAVDTIRRYEVETVSQPDTIGVYRPSSHYFYLRNDNSAGSPDFIVPLGDSGDIAVVGDWDGNGTCTIGVFRPGNSTFYLSNSNTTGTVNIVVSLGDGPNGDIPIVGDWDGNGTWTIGVFRPSTNTFFLNNLFENGHVDATVSLGGLDDVPIVGDWDGNGTTTIGLFRPSNNSFFLNNDNSQNWHVDVIAAGYGAPGDLPIVGDWDGNGTTTIGVYRSNVSAPTFYLRNTNTVANPDLIIPFGAQGDKPVAGHWQAPAPDSFSAARVDPLNRTGVPGEDLFSGNYNWSLPILGLAGRAGLDLGLSLSLNSLVWTRSGTTIGFDADKGFPTPGFRLGFPSIQQQTYISQSGASALLMITPSGGRVELRQVATSSLYESGDSSWLQLDTSPNPMILRTADGTQLSFQLFNAEYRCSEVKDRNGNFITINYDASGHITTIIDTLGRTVTFVYSNNTLQKITQLWNGAEHIWAQFEYGSLTIQTSFTGLSIVGVQNGSSITVLTKVILDDASSFSFEYTSYAQVKQINHKAADNHLLGYSAYDMSTIAGQIDCPRFTKRTDFAENWNNGNPVDTLFIFDRGTGFGQVTLPDGTVVKESHAGSGFKKGLTTQVQTFSSDNLNTPKKTSIVTWTQNNEALSYPQNLRVSETNVTDEIGNLRRVTISYSGLTLPSGTVCKLPSDTREYDAAGTTVLRKTHTDYLTTSAYLNQHIIGLPIAQYLYDSDSPSATPLSKVTFGYDAGSSLTSQGEPVHHDSSYGIGFLTRGNLTSVTRWDVTTLGGQSPQSVTSTMGYNTVGGLISTKDPLLHQVTIAYADSFAATGTPLPSSTLAYPTTVTDPDSYSSTAQYDYDLGAVRINTDPKGAVRTTSYDGAGRVLRIDISNGAYTRYEYPITQTQVDTYTLIQTGGAELYSTSVLDGAGRARATASSFPGSVGGYRGQLIVYDIMGRVAQQSNPTEITTTSGWVPAGDDAAAGWLYSSQTYDWKGRTRVSTNTDQTTRETTYGGCGCAGGEVVTIRDEMNRRQRMTYDVLGRLVKTESLNFDQSVYATRTDTYNARDQITRVFVQQGTSGTGQETLMTYDGHGRLETRKAPIEDYLTVYTYYADDTLKTSLDPRSASSTFIYNGRHLVTGITYCKPPGCTSAPQGPNEVNAIPLTPPVGFGYDEAGNRLWMTDGLGRVDYVYDTWSRLSSETRVFNDFPSSTYPVTYAYNLAGGLKTLTDPFGAAINYAFNDAGQLTSVTGSVFAGISQYASNMQYRAWGALKHKASGDGGNIDAGYNGRLQITSFAPNFGPSNYQYYADGRVSFVQYGEGSSFDKKYSYDHAGRLSEGLSGTDARGEQYNPDNPNPYKQTYTYDVFDNMAQRTNRWWTLEQGPFNATYVNDRNAAWQYDSAGNVKSNLHGDYTYDTAGKMKEFDSANTVLITQLYDGDGFPGYRSESRSGLTDRAIIYYIRSSVLGGQPITELKPNGGKRRTYVYDNGGEIARQEKQLATDEVTWIVRDPVTGDDDLNRDPLGAYLGNEFSVLASDYYELKGNSPTHDTDADPFDLSGGCTLDGVPFDCNSAIGLVNQGAAFYAPLKNIAPIYNRELRRYTGFAEFDPSTGQFERITQISTKKQPPVLIRRSGKVSPSGFTGDDSGVLGVRYENQNIQTALDRVRFSLQWSVPKDQQAPTGAIRECGKFRVKITLSNLQGGLENSAFVTRVEPSNDDAGGFRILGDLGVERKGDKATFTGTVQVGNIVSLNLNGASFIGMRVFIQVPPNASLADPDEVPRLKGLEVQRYKRDSFYDSFAVRDTILGASRTDPFKHCDNVPLKK